MREIDLKHAAAQIGGRIEIVKMRMDGSIEMIDRDEPLILFRGRDRLAVPLLETYLELCITDGCTTFQRSQVEELLHRFRKFASSHPSMMKQPGSSEGR